MRPTIEWYLQEAEPLHTETVTVVPRSRVLRVRTKNAAFVWHFPESVLVDGRRVAIVDVTLIVVLALSGVSVLALLLRRM